MGSNHDDQCLPQTPKPLALKNGPLTYQDLISSLWLTYDWYQLPAEPSKNNKNLDTPENEQIKTPKRRFASDEFPKLNVGWFSGSRLHVQKKKTTKLKRSQVPMEHLKICYVFTSSLNNPPPKKKKKTPPFAPPPTARSERFEDRGWWH